MLNPNPYKYPPPTSLSLSLLVSASNLFYGFHCEEKDQGSPEVANG